MQQHRVMTGLGNRQVELGIRRALFRTAHLFMARITVLQPLKCRRQPLAIDLRRPQRRVVGA
ncbi:hypothetical protein D3C81_2278460 [compost metagenome]